MADLSMQVGQVISSFGKRPTTKNLDGLGKSRTLRDLVRPEKEL